MKQYLDFLKRHSPRMILTYAALSVSLIFCGFSLIYSLISFQKHCLLEETIEDLWKNLEAQKFKQQAESHYLHKLHQADPYYIDKYLESLVFLEEETANLQILLRANPSDDALKQRLRHLKDGTNQLRFSEENLHRVGNLQEVDENQQHPVEINLADLKKLLTRIEEVPISPYQPIEKAPQLIIKYFDLFKKPVSDQEDTYLIQMNLIKRESVHE